MSSEGAAMNLEEKMRYIITSPNRSQDQQQESF